MDPMAAKFLGAGLACIGMGTAAIGVANVFGQFLSGALRNPSAELWVAEGFTQYYGALLIAMLLLFVL